MSAREEDGWPPQGGVQNANDNPDQAFRLTEPYRRRPMARSTAAPVVGSFMVLGCTTMPAARVPQRRSFAKFTASSRKATGSALPTAVSTRMGTNDSSSNRGSLASGSISEISVQGRDPSDLPPKLV